MKLLVYQFRHTFTYLHAAVTAALIAAFIFDFFQASGVSIRSLLKGVELIFPLLGPVLARHLILQEKDCGFLDFTLLSKTGLARVYAGRFGLFAIYLLLNLAIYAAFVADAGKTMSFSNLFIIGAAPALFFTAVGSLAGIAAGSATTGTAFAVTLWVISITLGSLLGGLDPIWKYLLPFPAMAGASLSTIYINKAVFLFLTAASFFLTLALLRSPRLRERLR